MLWAQEFFFTVKTKWFDQVLPAQATKKHLRYSDKKADAQLNRLRNATKYRKGVSPLTVKVSSRKWNSEPKFEEKRTLFPCFLEILPWLPIMPLQAWTRLWLEWWILDQKIEVRAAREEIAWVCLSFWQHSQPTHTILLELFSTSNWLYMG